MKRKQIISGVSTVLCTALVLGLSACGGKTNTPQTIPAVNDTVKDTAKDALMMNLYNGVLKGHTHELLHVRYHAPEEE